MTTEPLTLDFVRRIQVMTDILSVSALHLF